MSLPLPNLDDRDFQQLVEEARRQIMQSCPTWTDLAPGDPGIVLLELYAHLTETMIYRLNRLPQKAYIAFLRLLGVHMHPPAAASVTLRFSRSRAGDEAVEIPRGTRVTVNRADGGSEPPVFVTGQTVILAPGTTEVDVPAHQCEQVEAELVGKGTGLPGLTLSVHRPPIVAPTGDELDLVVATAVAEGELDERVPAVQYQGQTYRVWRAVENFIYSGPDPFVYMVDRMAGTITFAPAARMTQADGALEAAPHPLAAVPPAGREIRVWYRRGGGPAGNVAAGTLTTLKDPIAGVQVTNLAVATGGQAAETLENALVRGPQELHSLQRAVTAQDFELVALSSSRAVARAKALTRAALWTFAAPGTVEVLLVPDLPSELRSSGQVSATALQERESPEARAQIQQSLDERRPLGTMCLVNWARYKTVHVRARIVVRREEDQAAVRQRVLERIHGAINPLPTRFNSTGWPFGQALRASHVYDIALAEPGVRWVDGVRLLVDEVPDKAVTSVAADTLQPHTWYVASGDTLFRSLNHGDGWEPAGRFPGEAIEVVRVSPQRAGLVAVATTLPNNAGSRVHLSPDCGETWPAGGVTTGFRVQDLAWVQRASVPVLLLATDAGLYELSMQPGSSPVQVLVDPGDQRRGFYAVTAATDVRGGISVAVAAQANGGVYLSSDGGRPNSFRRIGLQGEDIRELAVQYSGPRAFLWAGAYTSGGDDPGHGAFRWELRGSEDPPEGWRAFNTGWNGGSCRSLAFLGSRVMAGTHRAGVVSLDPAAQAPAWQASDVRCGLPLRDQGRFFPVSVVATHAEDGVVFAGGSEGVYRSTNNGTSYAPSSSEESIEKVTLPPTWLFVSGEHDIIVVDEDEAGQ
jgi:hypothetical protein